MFGGKGGVRPNLGSINFTENKPQDLLIQALTGIISTLFTTVGLVSVVIHIGAHLYTEDL